MPKFSIITATYDKRPHSLRRAVECVAAQTFRDFEHLIGYQDYEFLSFSYEWIRSFVVPGPSEVGNKQKSIGIQEARGDWILFLDDDNVLFPEALEYINAAIDSDTQIVYSWEYCHKRTILKNEQFRCGEVDLMQWCIRADIAKKIPFPLAGYASDWQYFKAIAKTQAPIVQRIDEVIGLHSIPVEEVRRWPKSNYSVKERLNGIARNWDRPYPLYFYENGRFIGGPDRGDGWYKKDEESLTLKWDNWNATYCKRFREGFYSNEHELFLTPAVLTVRPAISGPQEVILEEFCSFAGIDHKALIEFMSEDEIAGREDTGDNSPVHRIEGQFLYALVRLKLPDTVLEFGTRYGYSTQHILSALKKNNKGHLTTVDIAPKCEISSDRLTIVAEDGIAFSKNWTDPVDMIFEDGPHSFDFTFQVLSELMPRLKTEGQILVHDIAYPPSAMQVSGGLLGATKTFYPIMLSFCGLGFYEKSIP